MTTLGETELPYVLVVQKRKKKKTILFFEFWESNYLAKKRKHLGYLVSEWVHSVCPAT